MGFRSRINRNSFYFTDISQFLIHQSTSMSFNPHLEILHNNRQLFVRLQIAQISIYLYSNVAAEDYTVIANSGSDEIPSFLCMRKEI